MINDFLYASIIGWIILLIFWLSILIFIFIRKPPKSKLTKKLVIRSLLVFGIVFLILFVVLTIDSFWL